MGNATRRTVCLLGPRNSGKSSLLRTIRLCLARSSHGYQPGYISSVEIKEITQENFDEGLSASDDSILTRFPDGSFSAEEEEFLCRESRTDGIAVEQDTHPFHGPIKYFFSLQWTAGALQSEHEHTQPYLLQVVDAAGELSTPSGRTTDEEALERHRIALDDVLRNTDGVILVAPPADGTVEEWATYLIEALEKLALRPAQDRRLKHIVILFSQYDRLFTRCGNDSVDIAVRQHAVLYTIRREYNSRTWLQRLAALHQKVPDIDLRFTVASALGFVTLFGNPNVDPNAGIGAPRFRTAKANGRDAAPLWRPFLTADPFIFAATGIPNAYMFTSEEITESTPFNEPLDEPDRPPPPPPGPSLREPSLFARVWQWFNAAGTK